MIALRALHHVALRVADLDEATDRWAAQFGLGVAERSAGRVRLACDDEPGGVVLLDDGGDPGLAHVAWELSSDCTPPQAADHLRDAGADVEVDDDGALRTRDADGNTILIVAYAQPASRLVAHARPIGPAHPPVGHPRALGHVNFIASDLDGQLRFYTEALGMRVTDWLGDGGVWLHLGSEHHVMALVAKPAPLSPHFHHLAFDVVDIGQLRVALDHLGRHGRWLGWGPVRHGIGGNVAAYVRIVEEECFVELYCDMERLRDDHVVRHWPDNRYSSNTWGPLPPRSYFRFDAAAVRSERESLEMQGIPLPDPPSGPARTAQPARPAPPRSTETVRTVSKGAGAG